MGTSNNEKSFMRRNLILLMVGLVIFTGFLGLFEAMGMFRSTTGMVVLIASVALYAGIGWFCRTNDAEEYYLAGKRIPGLYNGMAVASDWMSAASFVGLAGSLYVQGFDGLAFLMGWTGGYVLIGVLLAPYLRRQGAYTIPDFLAARFGGHPVRTLAILSTILVSFVYLIAQIHGVALIVSRMTEVSYTIGVFLGLFGIMFASLVGGMRAITWTQVVQVVIILFAYMIPAALLSYKITGIPVPQIMYGTVLDDLSERENQLNKDAKELDARAAMKNLSKDAKDRLDMMALNTTDKELVYRVEKWILEDRVQEARSLKKDEDVIEDLTQAVNAFPANADEYTGKLKSDLGVEKKVAAVPKHTDNFKGKGGVTDDPVAKLNFMALVLCLMIGSASLPHLLIRFTTASSASEARKSVTWSLFFIVLFYITIPAVAVFVKYDVYNTLVGTKISDLPFWVTVWNRADASLVSFTDFNKDGLLQLAELSLGGDLIVLASAEISGAPFFLTGLLAMGGFAAALSTADGLLLAMSSALSYDLYEKMILRRDEKLTTTSKRNVLIAKLALLVIAIAAGLVTLTKPGSILFMVAASFSLAASVLFVPMVLGVFWKRANAWGAFFGMLSGLTVTMYYMLRTFPFFTDLGIPKMDLWFSVAPIGSGVFGLVTSFVVMVVVTLLTPSPKEKEMKMVEMLRTPSLEAQD